MDRSKVAMAIIAMVLCAQFGDSKLSKDCKERPDVNIYGCLVDCNGKRTNVNNITINGRLRDVPVYAKPCDEEINPDVNTTRLNLVDIAEIKSVSPNTLTFSKREYVEITVVYNNAQRSSTCYIIDKRRKVFCESVEGCADMEVTFQALSRLIIQGIKPQMPELGRVCPSQECTTCPIVQQPMHEHVVDNVSASDEKEIDLLVSKTHELIETLEQKAHELPAASKEDRSLKTSILGTIKGLRDTVQNLFN